MKLTFHEKVLVLLALEEKVEDCQRYFDKSITEEHKNFWAERMKGYSSLYKKILVEQKVDPE